MTCESQPWIVWYRAADDSVVDTALRALYARIDSEIAKRGPTCWASGRCCRFDEFGHRLYVTGLEVVWILKRVRSNKLNVEGGSSIVEGEQGTVGMRTLKLSVHNQRSISAFPHSRSDGSCRFQVNKMCSVHAFRPLGCRVFYCQNGTQDWQRDLYERYLRDLRTLHDTHGLPYRYMEWRAALHAALGEHQVNTKAVEQEAE